VRFGKQHSGVRHVSVESTRLNVSIAAVSCPSLSFYLRVEP
jgi:hypothetical protein